MLAETLFLGLGLAFAVDFIPAVAELPIPLNSCWPQARAPGGGRKLPVPPQPSSPSPVRVSPSAVVRSFHRLRRGARSRCTIKMVLAVHFAALLLGLALSTAANGAASFAPVVPAVDGAMPTCKAVTANYITHGLPQQCLRTSRTSTAASLTEHSEPASTTPVPSAATTASHRGLNLGRPDAGAQQLPDAAATATTTAPEAPPTPPESSATAPNAEPTEQPAEPEPEDSPLDTANFLSFEEWKAQNLARAGQSSETFEPRQREHRKDPQANANSLDALGEDSEIELDFGFDSGNGGAPEYRVSRSDKAATPPPTESGQRLKSKDAGKTCRERFNYASFDCAATVHKTNPGCKGATSILVENKDSYMRNKCGQENKHFIVELCEDILVDTVVLANFEFFSSMFRTFRVSVSDRYPVKATGWKDLGTFEARNSRQVQAFLIENPLIWARYLKVELLTHYGNEFYCPVSLLRVHGTTMMEEFRHQEELARGDPEDDVSEELAPEAVAMEIAQEAHITPSSTSEESPTESHPGHIPEPTEITDDIYEPNHYEKQEVHDISIISPGICKPQVNNDTLIFEPTRLPVCGAVYTHSTTMRTVTSSEPATIISAGSVSSAITQITSSQSPPPVTQESVSTATSAQNSSQREATPTIAKPSTTTKPTESQAQEVKQQQQQNPPASQSHPPPASPTTQESFFKTVHKRLSLLEQNATLSLQYIEDQSRLLRDAFMKVEKRQMEKTAASIEQFNSKFIAELNTYKDKYDQLWQSTVIALESQREQSERDMAAVSTRLTILADEMIFQKRMYQIQSILLLITIGVVIFSRSSQLDTPLLKHMGTKNPRLREWDTPPGSPMPGPIPMPPPRRRSRSRRQESGNFEMRTPPPEEDSSTLGSPRTQSSPATPNGRSGYRQPFGPRLRVEHHLARGANNNNSKRLPPSPLCYEGSGEFEGVEEHEGEGLVGLGLDGVESEESSSS